MNHSLLPSSLQVLIQDLIQDFPNLSADRKAILSPLVEQIIAQRERAEPVKLVVICTHNSRRSHMGQLWLEVAAKWFGIDQVSTFSGGTEATAFNHRAVTALQEAGFPIQRKKEGTNPIYHCHLGTANSPSMDLFSKKFDAAPNPTADFIAVLVCDEAAEACPLVPGANRRLAVSFEDPKRYDDQPEEKQAYADKVKEIGREFLWVMQQVQDAKSRSNINF